MSDTNAAERTPAPTASPTPATVTSSTEGAESASSGPLDDVVSALTNLNSAVTSNLVAGEEQVDVATAELGLTSMVVR